MERIYLLVVTSSQEPFNPQIYKKNSLEEAIKAFNSRIADVDNDTWKIKCIDKHIDEEFERYSAKLLCNHKGWGYDFIRSVEVINVR